MPLSIIRTYDPSVQANQDSDRPYYPTVLYSFTITLHCAAQTSGFHK
jgi:hypothetical protein